MKKHRNTIYLTTLLTAFFLITTSNLFAQGLDNPGDYMTAISRAHSDMNKTYMAYMSAVAHSGRARKIERMRNQTIESITNCRYKIIDLPYYKGDNSLRQSSIDYVALLFKVFNEDYAHIVNMEEIAEQSYDDMQAYLLLQEKTNDKITEAYNKMDKASRDFAAKYKVTLIDTKSELSAKMEAASKLNSYHDKVYLIIFKCMWKDGQITEGLNKKNLSNVEQSRNALLSYAKEGLSVLDTLKHFEGDPSLNAGCRQALNFYKKIAENDLTRLTDYYLRQENFAKMKSSFEAKANHTKEEVNAFNKAVNEINASVGTYNQANNTINNGRNQALQNWVSIEQNYLNTHMPYFKA